MARSLKKGPYLNTKLLKKVAALKESGSNDVIKTWARDSMIVPSMIGIMISVYNGKKFISLYINEGMVGYKLGDFVPTRVIGQHGGKDKKKS